MPPVVPERAHYLMYKCVVLCPVAHLRCLFPYPFSALAVAKSSEKIMGSTTQYPEDDLMVLLRTASGEVTDNKRG